MDEAFRTRLYTAETMGWQRAAELVALIGALWCTDSVPPVHHECTLKRGMWRAGLRLVRLAEAMVRRLLFLLAAQLPPPRNRTGKAGETPVPDPYGPRSGETGSINERTPSFRLFEHVPSLEQMFADVPPAVRQHAFAPLRDAGEDVLAAGLLRRLSALQGVLDARRQAARRLQRWLSARRGEGLVHNLRPGWPSGVSRSSGMDGSRVSEMSRLVRCLAQGPPGQGVCA